MRFLLGVLCLVLFPFILSAQLRLVWSDEFDVNGTINTTQWFAQTQLPNGNSWYNGEIQHYTNRLKNAFVQDGFLNVVALKETFVDQGVAKNYTSARLNTKFAFKYGRVEIRAKLPSGVGTWPAFWLLGKDINEPGAYWQTQGFGTTPWPQCGEIDLMEHWGSNQNYIQAALHTPSSFGNTVNLGGLSIPTASTDFHVYSMNWTANQITFFVDGNPYYTYAPSVKNAQNWPFDREMFLLINLAILPNIPLTISQAKIEVDYVRVYQQDVLSTTAEQPNQLTLTPFPNPFSDHVAFKIPEFLQQAAQYELYAIDGRLIQEGQIQGDTNFRIDGLSGLSTGLYLLKVKTSHQVYVFKMVKQGS